MLKQLQAVAQDNIYKTTEKKSPKTLFTEPINKYTKKPQTTE